jgi:lipopolysaccharide transport system ATP-binding protein
MSSEWAIRTEGLGKCYTLYDRPQDRLLQMLSRGRRRYSREFWALRDVSLEVSVGETFAIVGRNGSGKSTLLQLICGTLYPTTGEVRSRGRVAALLELGAGFNPEFTGRENVHLAAALYGLDTAQIEARFDRIAAFADIGEHLDQPVKTYSSGMYVRLAFAVIAHVDADILVIDEALAVGDAVFTQKCMRFIRTFQKTGTLLFVSHDMSSVVNLCQRAIWLEHGKIVMQGTSKAVSEAYLRHTLQSVYGESADLQAVGAVTHDASAPAAVDAPPEPDTHAAPALDYGARYDVTDNLEQARGFHSGGADLVSITFENLDRPGEPVFAGGERVRVEVVARANRAFERPIIGFVFNDRLGQALFGENTLPFTDATPVAIGEGGALRAEFVFRLPMLPNGDYAVFASVADGTLHDNVQHHLLHDAMLVKVYSSTVRWGLVGVPFEHVSLSVSE